MNDIGVRVQEKGQVTIPRNIRNKLNLRPGDLVLFIETDAGVLLKPASLVSTDQLQAEVSSVVRSIRDRFEDYSANEIESLVNDAIRETRANRG